MPDHNPSLRKAGFGKRLIWRVEALAYDIVSGMLAPFSFDRISAFGGWLLRKIGPLTRKHHIARRGLETAFPNASEAQIGAWLDAQWDNTGRTFAEFPVLHRVKVFEPGSRVTVEGLEHLEAIKVSEQPAIIVTGHFANWEIMATVLVQIGLSIRITYRRINNPYLDARVRAKREAYGTRFLVPKSGAAGARQLLGALKEGDSVALLNDQKFNQGISIPFFGVDAMTAPGPTRLALGAGAPIVLMSVIRDKARFHVKIEPPITLTSSGDTTDDVHAGVRMITGFIENRIRETPPQWFWVHRRWPKEHYK